MLSEPVTSHRYKVGTHYHFAKKFLLHYQGRELCLIEYNISMSLTGSNSSSFWDRLLEKEIYKGDFGPMTEHRIRLAKSFKKNIGNKVLNIGSGQGFLEQEFAPDLEVMDFHSVDISRVGLELIGKRYGTKIKKGNILNLPYKGNYFDTVYCMEVLEHVAEKDTPRAYKEIKRVTNKDGEIIISVPVNEPRSLKNHPVGHVKKYTPFSIERELIAQGFKITHKKLLYAFSTQYEIKTFISNLTGIRKPNIAIFRCVI